MIETVSPKISFLFSWWVRVALSPFVPIPAEISLMNCALPVVQVKKSNMVIMVRKGNNPNRGNKNRRLIVLGCIEFIECLKLAIDDA